MSSAAAAASATTGSNGGKQQSTGLLSAITSLNPFGKSSKGAGGKGSGSIASRGGRNSSSETVPRSYGLNGGFIRADSERISATERSKAGAGGLARRSSESSAPHASHPDGMAAVPAGIAEFMVESSPLGGGLAPKATVGLMAPVGEEDSPSTLYAGRETDIELGFPAGYIIRYWKEKEEKKFKARMSSGVRPPADYAAHRRYMVDWISEVGEQLDLQTVTIHSAVSFLDELMIQLDYNTREWHLYAVCCLSVAAKYEEAECNMPMISELADATEMSLTTPIVTRGELELVQNRMQWDVSRVTAMHFLGYYTSQGVTMPEDTCQGRRLVEKVVKYMIKYVDFFANLCQQDYQFQNYRPSHIAAAAILAARRALCIKPVWREELTELTGYTMEDILECGEELWNFYEKMFPTHKPLRTDATAALKKAAEQHAAAGGSSAGAAPSSGSNAAIGANAAHVMGVDTRAGATASAASRG